MDVFTKHAASLASVGKYLGTARPYITFPAVNGKTYPCLAGSHGGGKDLGIGGFELKDSIKLVVLTSVFGAAPLPQEKNQIIYKLNAADKTGILRRIDSITTTPNGNQMHMTLVPISKGV